MENSSMHILQIDDSKALCQFYHDLFTPRGYKFESTNDGKEGLELARENNYDVILLDMLMPKFGGMQFLEELKNTKPSELKKVMIVSQMEYDDDEIKKLIEFGVHSVQKKSLKYASDLINLISNRGNTGQNKEEDEGADVKETVEPKMHLEEAKAETAKKQKGVEPKMHLEEASENTIKKIDDLKLELKERKNQITKLNQELRSARILKKYTLEKLNELENETTHNYDHKEELEKIPEIKIRSET